VEFTGASTIFSCLKLEELRGNHSYILIDMDSVVRLSFGVRGSRKSVRLNIGRSDRGLLKLHAAAFLDDRKIVDTAESEEAKSIKREHLQHF
jgi:hypothetical protein